MRALSIDDAYVVHMAEMIDQTLQQAFLLPSCTDKNREEIQQVVAVVMLALRRYKRMGLTPEGRHAVVVTASEILAELEDGQQPNGNATVIPVGAVAPVSDPVSDA